jgi:hypothetical protein
VKGDVVGKENTVSYFLLKLAEDLLGFVFFFELHIYVLYSLLYIDMFQNKKKITSF